MSLDGKLPTPLEPGPAETADFCVPPEPGCGRFLYVQSLARRIREPNNVLAPAEPG